MLKRLFAFFVLVATLILILPHFNDETSAPSSSKKQMEQKSAILQHDMALTGKLNRKQYLFSLLQTSSLLNTQNGQQVKHIMTKQLATLPAYQYLWLIDQVNALEYTEGKLASGILHELQPMLEKAAQQLKRQDFFESEMISLDGEKYYILGTAVDSTGVRTPHQLIGIVTMPYLHEVEAEQRKNLRIVPYPSDHRLNMQSVDSNTMQHINVDNAQDNIGTSHYHEKQIVVKFKHAPADHMLKKFKKDLSITHVEQLGTTFVFHSKTRGMKQLLSYFKSLENVVYAEPHFLYLPNRAQNNDLSGSFTPNDALFSDFQWNLPLIDTLQGWDINRGSEEILIAVIDTGVDLEHPDLIGQLSEGYNVVNPDLPPQDDVGHGTHVAGIIGAQVNNQEGIAGMNWYSRIMPVKVLDKTGAGSTYAVAQGIIWAVDHGADVINLSLGNYAQAEFLHDAIKYAYERDVVLIAATGNDNTDQLGFPAAYPEVIAVSATDDHGKKATFSNYGDYVDVVAPGVSIASTYMNHQYAALSGTSMASPHVAALAAMIKATHPVLNNQEIKAILVQTSNDLGPSGKDKYYGYGQINVNQALSSSMQFRNSLLMQQYWKKRE